MGNDAKRTPGKWTMNKWLTWEIHDEDGRRLAMTLRSSRVPALEEEANADFIVRAANAYDDLLAACEIAVTLFEGDDEANTPGTSAWVWLQMARTAIALATEANDEAR